MTITIWRFYVNSKIIYVYSNEKDEVSIYPNPSSGRIFIKSEKKIMNLELYDIYGKFISKYNVTNNQFDLDLPNGLYYINLENNFFKIRIFK